MIPTLLFLSRALDVSSFSTISTIRRAPFVASSFFLSVIQRTATKANSRRFSSSENAQSYDVIVIGGGSAGLTAAKLSSGTLGASCLLIEGDQLGGDCTHTGCVPSKSLIAISAAERMNGIGTSDNTMLQTTIQNRIYNNIQSIYERDDSPEILQNNFGVTVLYGKATLVSSNTVEVVVQQPPTKTITVEAKKGIILCTGASSKVDTKIMGLTSVPYYTYETIWSNLDSILSSKKRKMTIIGGGPVGCELAQSFQRLGLQVTIVTSNQLLSSSSSSGQQYYDDDAGQLLERIFRSEGITVMKGKVQKVEPFQSTTKDDDDNDEQQEHVVTAIDGGSEYCIRGDILLVAVGRVPRIQNMGLETVGVSCPDGKIQVNEKLQTSVKNIYAAGDCIGDRQLYVFSF